MGTLNIGKPVVKLSADIPPEIKEKAMRVAQEKGITLKELLVQLIQALPEPEEQPKKRKQ